MSFHVLTTAWYLFWLWLLEPEVNVTRGSCSSPISSLEKNSLSFWTLRGWWREIKLINQWNKSVEYVQDTLMSPTLLNQQKDRSNIDFRICSLTFNDNQHAFTLSHCLYYSHISPHLQGQTIHLLLQYLNESKCFPDKAHLNLIIKSVRSDSFPPLDPCMYHHFP